MQTEILSVFLAKGDKKMPQKTLEGANQNSGQNDASAKNIFAKAKMVQKFAMILAPTKAVKKEMRLKFKTFETHLVESKYGEYDENEKKIKDPDNFEGKRYALCILVEDIDEDRTWNLRLSDNLLSAVHLHEKVLQEAEAIIIKTSGTSFETVYYFEAVNKKSKA